MVNGFYNHLGPVAPATVQAKDLLRKLTAGGYDWDNPLREHRRRQREYWQNSLHALHDLRIRRSYAPMSLRVVERKELHVFSDATTKAIAAVAHLCVIDKDGNMHGLVVGKAKLIRRPEHTIPRLELCAAALAVEIDEVTVRELDLQLNSVAFYTDSKVVLGYISETKWFYVYTANRVQRIRESTRPEQWNYMRMDKNSADPATRMAPASRLKCTNWHAGPDFLLTQKHGNKAPTQGKINTGGLYRRHWQQVQDLENGFRTRWRVAFLTTLQQRRNWQKTRPHIQEKRSGLLKR